MQVFGVSGVPGGTLTLVSVVDEAPEQLVADVAVLHRREAELGCGQQ